MIYNSVGLVMTRSPAIYCLTNYHFMFPFGPLNIQPLMRAINENEQPLPFPPLHITALESPTFATSKRSPTKIAVDAVEPASLF